MPKISTGLRSVLNEPINMCYLHCTRLVLIVRGWLTSQKEKEGDDDVMTAKAEAGVAPQEQRKSRRKIREETLKRTVNNR